MSKDIKQKSSKAESIISINWQENIYKQLRIISDNLIDNHVSDSVILVGSEGCGKTTLLKKLETNLTGKNCVNLVKLYCYLYNDEKSAFSDAANQLNRICNNEMQSRGGYAGNMNILTDVLANQKKKIIVFFIEEIDLLATKQRQNLLYSLFSACHISSVPTLVVGTTRRLDMIELLEKRVRSRFSGRILQLINTFSFEEFTDFHASLLSAKSLIPDCLSISSKKWNSYVKSLLIDPQIKNILQAQFHYSKSLGAIKKFLYLVITHAKDDDYFSLEDFTFAWNLISTDYKIKDLLDLPTVELVILLVVSNLMKKCEIIHFETVYNEFKIVCFDRPSFPRCDKEVAFKIYEHLVEINFLSFLHKTGTRFYQPVVLTLDRHLLISTIIAMQNPITSLVEYAQSSF